MFVRRNPCANNTNSGVLPFLQTLVLLLHVQSFGIPAIMPTTTDWACAKLESTNVPTAAQTRKVKRNISFVICHSFAPRSERTSLFKIVTEKRLLLT